MTFADKCKLLAKRRNRHPAPAQALSEAALALIASQITGPC
ncbi:hypothetical protein [Mesorhizobium sp.]|nr:hypothetical protein [Mesorhizobium sp.]